ncbi:MAG: hypothetical protein WB491_14745 [Candidatus Aquilonibacter sp.]
MLAHPLGYVVLALTLLILLAAIIPIAVQSARPRVRSLLLMAGIIPLAVSQVIWAPHDLDVILARLVCVAAYLPMTWWYAKAVRTAQNDILRLDHAS